MSTSPSPTRPVLPSAAVDRVFERMLAIFGVQRMAAAWGDVPADERRAVWGAAVARAVWSPEPAPGGRFDLESIGAALDELAAEPTSWPPSSGEFADRCERFAQRPGRRLPALPVPRRTEAELQRGREQMDRIKAMLAGTLRRPRAAGPSREPGSDDEPLPAPAAPATCRCWVGLVRSPTLCESCAAFRRNRATMDSLRDGTAERMAEQLRDAA